MAIHLHIIHGYNLHDFPVKISNVFVPPMTHVQKAWVISYQYKFVLYAHFIKPYVSELRF